MRNLLRTLSVAAATILGVAGTPSLYAMSGAAGTLQITVLDENGQLVQDAPVYIYGEHKTKFVGGKEIPGTTTLEMQPGDYRVSTALIKHTGDYVDRFASHEAHVKVVEGDNTSLILTLLPIQDPMSSISYAEVQKMGVPSEIARNLKENNSF